MKRILTYIILTILLATNVSAQSPFNLKRGQTRETETKEVTNPNTNPFDLVRNAPLTENNNPQKLKADFIVMSKSFPRPSSNNRLISLFILLGFSTLILGYSTKTISKSLKLISNTNMFLRDIKSQKTILPHGEQLLILILFVLNVTFILLFSRVLQNNSFLPLDYWNRFLIILIFIIIVFMGKYFINSILAFVFETTQIFKIYHHSIFNIITLLTVIFIPLNLMLIYSQYTISLFSQYAIVFLLALSFLFFVYRNLILSSNQLSKRFFHFILYLCAFEIVPIALFTKILLK